MIQRKSLRCEYCGVELILVQSGLLLRKVTSCPKCGNSIGEGAWFCVNCREVLQEDTRLKEIQKRLLFLQEKYRQAIPEIAYHIEPGEFIYYVSLGQIKPKRCYVVTDRKFIASRDGKVEGKGLLETTWSEVVGVGEPQEIGFGYFLNVQTFNGETNVGISDRAWELYGYMMDALNDYIAQRKDIRAIICSLKL